MSTTPATKCASKQQHEDRNEQHLVLPSKGLCSFRRDVRIKHAKKAACSAQQPSRAHADTMAIRSSVADTSQAKRAAAPLGNPVPLQTGESPLHPVLETPGRYSQLHRAPGGW